MLTFQSIFDIPKPGFEWEAPQQRRKQLSSGFRHPPVMLNSRVTLSIRPCAKHRRDSI